MKDQVTDLMGEGEPQPVLFPLILVNILIDTDTFKIFGQEAIDIDLFEETKDRDGSEPQLDLDYLDDGNREEFDGINMAGTKIIGFFTDLRPS